MDYNYNLQEYGCEKKGMQKLSYIVFMIIIVVCILIPLLEAIENGFGSLGGYYSDIMVI